MIEYGSFSMRGPGNPDRHDAIHAHLSRTSGAGYFALADGNPLNPTSGITADLVARHTVCDAALAAGGQRGGLTYTIVRGANAAGYLLDADRTPKANVSLALIRLEPGGELIEAAGIGDLRVYGYRHDARPGELLLDDAVTEAGHRSLYRTTGYCYGRGHALDPNKTAAACGLGVYCDYHPIRQAAAKRSEYRRLIAVTAGVHTLLADGEIDAIAGSSAPPADAAQLLVDAVARRARPRAPEAASRTALVMDLL